MEKIIDIEGMRCKDCAAAVAAALSPINGVSNVRILLQEKKDVVSVGPDIPDNVFTAAITDAGYNVSNIE